MILDESKPDTIPGHNWLSFFYRLCLILSLLYRTFPQRFTHFLWHFVATHVYTLLYSAFSHRLNHNLVAFCCKSLRAFVKNLAGSLFFLAGSLFSSRCLSQNLRSPPWGVPSVKITTRESIKKTGI